MYVASIVLLLLVLPVLSIIVESLLPNHGDLIFLTGRWFVFWAAGIRLFVAGVRQVFQPSFTAEIFGLKDPGALGIVREVGFGNLSIGLLAVCSVFRHDWVVPAAIVGGLYYGLAGIGHIGSKERNVKENAALISDLWIFLVLAAFVIKRLI